MESGEMMDHWAQDTGLLSSIPASDTTLPTLQTPDMHLCQFPSHTDALARIGCDNFQYFLLVLRLPVEFLVCIIALRVTASPQKCLPSHIMARWVSPHG